MESTTSKIERKVTLEPLPTDKVSAQYEIPEPAPFVSFDALKDRIKKHYELASDYYYSLWGEHIHHGLFLNPRDTKEKAQVQLIQLLLDRSALPKGSSVLDVGCGIGGTSRHLALHYDCNVTGVTISGRQVELAKKLSIQVAETHRSEIKTATLQAKVEEGVTNLCKGSVKFIELDAEKMGEYFGEGSNRASFDCVWISEAMSHLPDKALFFRNTFKLLKPGGRLVIADWFKRAEPPITEQEMSADIKPIEDGMLLPPLCSQQDYINFAQVAGLSILSDPLDISKDVKKTWDISWSLVQSPSLWAFAIAQGRDGLAFLQAFWAMRRGFANGTFRYAVMVFKK